MKKILVILWFISSSLTAFTQSDEDFRFWEDSLKNLRFAVMRAPTEELRLSLNEDFMNLLESVLMEDHIFDFTWDSTSNFSVVTSPDNLFKIFTWFLVKDDYSYENFGFIHVYNQNRQKYILYPLYDRKNTLSYPEYEIADINQWYGAVYYKIIPLVDKKTTYYTLLGWNGNDIFTNEKIIEVLQFDLNSNSPVIFGAKVFKGYTSKVARVIMKYSKNASLSLKYENQKYQVNTGKRDPKTKKWIYEVKSSNMIIFDELINPENGMPNIPAFMVPESSLNQGFIAQNGKWQFITGVLGRNPDRKYDPKEIQRRQYYTKDTNSTIQDN
ncbi:MAG TPA: hypothetical protein PLI77_00605 [Bacteroidales bacterium]|nr:hypothetical protein [Bacteroidales bacterium]